MSVADQRFLNREMELRRLAEVSARGGAQFVAVYGRRRIGKTALLLQWLQSFPEKRRLYWVAQRGTPGLLLEKLSGAVGALVGTPEVRYPTWEAALAAVGRVAKDEPVALVIDELPYLLESAPEFASVLQAVWDRSLSRTRLCLAVAGSHYHMMQDTFTSGKGPLFGRTTADLFVDELTPAAIRLFLRTYSDAQIVQTYSVLGGVPKYLEMWSAAVPVLRNVQEVVLSPVSIFRNEPMALIHDEIAEPRTYLAVLEAIGPGAARPSDVALRAGVQASHVTKYLKTLEALRFVRRVVSIESSYRADARVSQYEIRDPYLRFHFSFVQPNLRLVEQGRIDRLMEIIRAGFDSYVGRTGYEELCRKHVAHLADEHALPFEALDVGRIWDRRVEIDVAALDRSGDNALVAECRWRRKKMGVDDLEALIAKAKALTKLKKTKLHFGLFSRAGFTQRLRTRAEAEGHLLYEGIPSLDR